MSERWKSGPNYWCKHCSVFVRDTKLERANHEATGRHQGALKRFMRDLHRNHEREEREKERAKREIERLNGVVSGTPRHGSRQNATATASSAPTGTPTAAELARQREELAKLGVAMPSEFRGEMAMPGDWTVTKTRVIQDDNAGADGTETKDAKKAEAKATGVRKRVVTEEEQEAEEAARALFKRQKRWGGTKTMPEDDAELDALLSGGGLLAPKTERTESEEATVKKEEEGVEGAAPGVKVEEPEVKTEADVKEESADDGGALGVGMSVDGKAQVPPALDAGIKAEEGSTESTAPVVFKKRKPKNVRQK
ncbi:hypothetical protein ACRALDRAFT_1060585 [Sodiomyces alcalophilus JCM 7366]|uniref:uncharacterized protein n=1 Tax=Sodiomyces alcalophilus JCM 7366 TaxID=591952 RepID=UPI0039B4C5D2